MRLVDRIQATDPTFPRDMPVIIADEVWKGMIDKCYRVEPEGEKVNE